MINWNELNQAQQQTVLQRPVLEQKQSLTDAVSQIINAVKQDGDQALIDMTEKFDKVSLSQLSLDSQVANSVLATLSKQGKQAIEQAYNNIKTFHEAQKQQDVSVETAAGVTCELKTVAIDSVGLYIPGGSAPLPSTVLMLGVPAQIAGCPRKVLCTPPFVGDSGNVQITAEIIYAAKLCGINEIYTVGGAQAVAALAYGTESIKAVDKIYGPGNSFVTEAKQQVSLDINGAVIDMPAGPSEVLVIADDNANPDFIAADLLSQAEHGPDSQVILVCHNQQIVEQTQICINEQLQVLPRKEIAEKALDNSQLIVTENLEQSIVISNQYAPEHLIVQTDNARALLPKLKNAASIFLGAYTPESAGDYASGTNHVLPTYGYSKVLSSLNLNDFCRKYTVQEATAGGLKNIADAIITMADAEGLQAHLNAVAIRLEQLKQQGA